MWPSLPDIYYVNPIELFQTAIEHFDVVMNGSIEKKQALYDKRDTLLGKQVTVKHFGHTKYGVAKLPKGKDFRDVN